MNVEGKDRRRMLLDFFDITKGGKIFFNLIAIYILFTSITLPIIKYYIAKSSKTRHADDITRTKEYFNKVLNTPSLVYLLRNIAVKEFSAENVLFWENYQILQNMNYRHYNESKKAEDLNGDVSNARLISQYDYDGYYQQQIQSVATDAMTQYAYDPSTPVPKEILPFYQNFFKTFIHKDGKAVVNISGNVSKTIHGDMSFPTVGIFDQAKEEVVDMMYNSIYPIFIQKYKKQLDETFV
ncbi:hypothetical protein PIROE2DRAFT_8134 [Piromyces sp. E2]|nr:hypothetical protein PIROE2DRAFT_8134 [Piromyces sp. E2]|eukprot:OUM64918.1 hypothetical protein PIROE2DRAFT_8134 [Piromyces sp. E2]